MIVALTYYGDANLDGTVNMQDFNLLAANFGGSGEVWSLGDFNYDGMINALDLNALASDFGLSGALPGDLPVGLDALVPEPGSIALIGVGLVTVLGSSRRRRQTNRM